MKRRDLCRGAVGRVLGFKKWIGLAIILIAAVAGAHAAIPPDQGPGGPILVVTSAANPFSKYYAEILRAEGLNSFSVIDGTLLTPATLNAYDVVVLGQFPLTAAQVTMLSDYVSFGGNLIAMRPDNQLSGLLGLTATGSTLTDQYLLIDNATTAGAGLVKETIQFHGTADLYAASGALSLATLYSSSSTATSYPAVTWRSVGYLGGQVAAFTFDLARSIVYTRQGNPAWAKQLRDPNPDCQVNGAQPCATGVQLPPIMPYDLFYGPLASNPQPSWVDFSKITIPQADEQQRLLANLILLMNVHRKPLPRFWYFPRGNKAVVIMTGDDHANGGTQGRFETYKAASPAGCAVANWECVRSTSYIYSNSPLSDAQAVSYNAVGFEVAAHLHTNCTDWTSPTGPNSYFQNQLYAFSLAYPSLPAPTTNRTHCTPWSDYSSHASAELNRGIRLDTTYYYYPATWVLDRPGLFTGSGMPMRFATNDGTMIDVYQAVTQMTDQSGMTYSNHISSLLDKAIGAEGYYGAFTANMHTDSAISSGSDAILGAALLRRVPIVSAKQMLTWLDGRNSSYFGGLAWANNLLSFTIAAGAGADGMQAMVPTTSVVGPLVGVNLNGSPVAVTKQVVKGIEYAFFPALAGAYTALYTPDATPPDTLITSGPAALTNNANATFTFASTKSDGAFACSLDGSAFVTCSSPKNYPGLYAGGHTFSVRATDLAGNADPSPATYGWNIGNFVLANITDTSVADFSAGALSNTYLTRSDNGEIMLAPTAGGEFFGSALPAGWSSTPYVAGGGVSFGNGVATVGGTLLGQSALYSSGRSMEFVGTFTTKANQYVGFSADLTSQPWAIFSTWTGGGLYARSSNGTKVRDTLIPGNWLGAPHRFRIDWNAGNVDFYIDGALVVAHSITFAGAMRPLIADTTVGGASLTISWVRMTPYAASGIFYSRIFDAGTVSTWGSASWTGATPVGTTLGISVRKGNTPTPDSSWTSFSALAISGAAIPGASRYLQYAALLSTTDATQTPVLNDVTISYVGGVDSTPPDTAIVSEPTDPTNSTSANFGFTSTKAASAFGCSLDGGSFLSCSNPTLYSALAGGTHNFRVRATDTAGNTDPTPASFSWTIDLTAPETTILTSPASTGSSSSASFGFGSSRASSTFSCSLDGSAFAACVSPATYSSLAPGTHVFLVRATDSFGNTDPTPASFTWTITSASLSAFSDTTVADFGAGTPVAGIFVGKTADGNVSLAPTVGADFTGAALPAGWFTTNYSAGGGMTYAGGGAIVNGTRAGTNTFFSSGRAVEFVANFSGGADYQDLGFAADLRTPPWAIFGTWGGGGLYARSQNSGAAINTPISGYWFGAPHRFRIDWNASSIVYSIDGTVVATHSIAITDAMRPMVDDYYVDAKTIGLTSMRMTPYVSSGTFRSRIFDAAGSANWGVATWTGSTPAGTNLQLSVRLGNTPAPDVTWTAFAALGSSGSPISGTSRYLQYQALFTTADITQTPGLSSFSVNPTVVTVVPTTLTDATVADFTAGTPDGGIYIGQSAGGKVSLSASGVNLTGSGLPAGWSIIGAGGNVAFGGGVMSLDGARLGTNAFYSSGRSVEFVATFGSGVPYQEIGFAADLNGPPWAIFGTLYGGGLYARTQNSVTAIDTKISGSWTGASHRYRIDWNVGNVVYSIDGAVVATHSVSITSPMRPMIDDYYRDGVPLTVVSLQMGSYAPTGTFLSRVLDGVNSRTWGVATWTSSVPAGTSLAISVRLGNTPVPDATWTAFAPIGSGSTVSGASRYLQYRAVLSTTDATQTPALNDITFR